MAETSSTPVHSNIASNPKTSPKKNQKQAGLLDKLKGFIFNETNHEIFNKLAASVMKFFDEVSNETTGPTSKIKEYDNLILHYQGSILKMYKQKAQLSDEAEIGDLTEIIKASQGMLRDVHAQCEFWVKKRDEEHGGIPKVAAASSSTKSSNEDSAHKRQREEISHQQNGTEESSTSDED